MIKNKNCQQTKEKGELPQSIKGLYQKKNLQLILYFRS